MLKAISATKASEASGSVAVADGGGGCAIPHIGISPAIVGRDSIRIKVAAAQKLRKVFINVLLKVG